MLEPSNALPCLALQKQSFALTVITSYSIHYTKLYDLFVSASAGAHSLLINPTPLTNDDNALSLPFILTFKILIF